jgi:hypothetical protein
MHTPDITEENYQKLAALFPNAVTETVNEDGEVVRAIDADVLRQEMPFYAVFRDSSMATDSVMTNFEQIFETYSPNTVRKVL